MLNNSMWQHLADQTLPTTICQITFPAAQLRRDLAAFDFAGFILLNEAMKPRDNFDFETTRYYFSLNCAANVRAQRNHFGPVFSIEISDNRLQLEECGYDNGDCQNTAMQLLHHLLVERELVCSWQAYSLYYDSGERSEVRYGSEIEIHALLINSGA